MNLALVDPFVLAQDMPEALIARLRSSGAAVCLRFNRQGDLLASGTAKGAIAIFDLETHGVARKLHGHTPGRQVQSLSWSACGRYLLSSSVDWKAILWDLNDGSRIRTVNLGAPIYIAELHPHNHLLCTAALFEAQPVLIQLDQPTAVRKHLSSTPKRSAYDNDDKQAVQDAKNVTTVTVFTPSGHHIIAGTTKGWLNIIHAATCNVVYSTRLSNKALLLLRLTISGRDLLVNAADSIIRTIRLPDLSDPDFDPDNIRLEVEHKFQDVVNRLSWNHVAFSPSGDYVMASTLMNHDIYIWERGHGSLVKILEGPKEELGAVEWHPLRPFVAATGVESGRIYLWSVNTPQRWSALAPDFSEVEENIEYIEAEDEFDIHPIEELHKRRLDLEDEHVDVLTIDPAKPGQLTYDFRMPVLLDIHASDSEEEMVAIGAGQYRRKSQGAESEWFDNDEVPMRNASNTAANGQPKRRRD
jgi:COMPASS component SWD1